MSNLDAVRQEIDDIDVELVRLLGRRFELCLVAGTAKSSAGMPMMQGDRVSEVLRRAEQTAASHGVDGRFARALWQSIIDEACRLEDAANGKSHPAAFRLERIDHVAIAVLDLETAIAFYRQKFGMMLIERRETSFGDTGMLSAVMRSGGVVIVLVQGTNAKSNVSRYIANYGPGVQHVAIEATGLPNLVPDLEHRGVSFLSGIIHGDGLDQIFTKRDPNSGMQLEFVERTGSVGFDNESVAELFRSMEREEVC